MESIVPGAIVEGRLAASEQHVADHARAPQVGAGARLLAVHHLRGHELDGALQLHDVHPPRRTQLLGQPEVDYFQPIVRVLKDSTNSLSD